MGSEEIDLSSAITEVQQALERLRIASLQSPPRGAASSSPEWEVVDTDPAGQLPGSSASPSPPLCGYPRAARVPALPVSRTDTENSFAECPQYCLDLCIRLSAGPLSSEARAQRAWRAGKWAAEVLAGRWATPLSSSPLAIKPVCYVVLRSDLLQRPARFSSFTALPRAIGEIHGSNAVLQSFGSLAEAKVYCYGAGVPFPEPFA